MALTLLAEGKSILIFDELSGAESSRIAPGIVNPAALKRLATAWKAEEFVPFAEDFYHTCEAKFSSEFYFKKPLYHVFHDERGVAEWKNKKNEIPFLGTLESLSEKLVANPYGCGIVHECGNLDTKSFLNLSRKHFLSLNILKNENFDPSALNAKEGTYKSVSAQKFIFCEGWRNLWNPYFSWLPLVPTKGEIINYECQSIEPDKIIHKSVLLLPQSEKTFRAGSTFNRFDLTLSTNEEGCSQIQEGVKQFFKPEIKRISTDVGIRPTVVDRRPLCGVHPKFEKLLILNGLGAKGVMMAPLLSKQMLGLMDNKTKPLFPEADITRFANRLPQEIF